MQGNIEYNVDTIKKAIEGKIQRYYGITIEDALPQQIYNAVATTVRDQIMQQWVSTRKACKNDKGKRLYYMSVEFLTGRMLYSNMINLVSDSTYKQALKELDIDIEEMMNQEPEPGLGNGGLGRLAAAFMDSLATLNLRAMGCTIRYEYGLFRQRIIDDEQIEVPDNWLQNGNVWEVAVPEESVDVHFGGEVQSYDYYGQTRYETKGGYIIRAIPYDMPIVGFDTNTVDSLRMWSARSTKSIDLHEFGEGNYDKALYELQPAEVISKVLYPEDSHYEGKMLRLKQHYFLASATVQYAVRDYVKKYGKDLSKLPQHAIFHINDTHPGLAIPELLRILLDDYAYGWDESMEIVRNCMAYTNHTVMAEALERWPEDMVKNTIPRIYMLLVELNKRLCENLFKAFPGQWERIGKLAIISYGQIHMANMCVAISYSVNGVSKLHGSILKNDLFSDYYSVFPQKFDYVTNGITHRRWLMSANQGLTSLIEETIGEGFKKDAMELENLMPYVEDAAFREKYAKVKLQNKERLAKYLRAKQGIDVDTSFMFDVQAKRLHEYKRQLLNALHILVLYNQIVDDPSFTMPPRAFFFGAKASPSYTRAKEIIHFINALARLVDSHPRARKMLKVVFVENYNVSIAEILIPAAEVSQQLSTAGKEASGTGNMKFMMNGALTIGTMDGANVEMFEAVGRENIYIFGMNASEVANTYSENKYNPMDIFKNNFRLRRALTQIIDGTVIPEQPALMQDLYHSLLMGSGGMADPYFVLKDFGSYSMKNLKLMEDYKNQTEWTKRAIINTAKSGIFSIDRTIQNYNNKIWHITPMECSTK